MPVITLVALHDALGGTLPARCRFIATASRVRTSGPTVTLPRRIVVDIVNGVPLTPLDIPPSDGMTWGWTLQLVDLDRLANLVERFVTIPNVGGPIDWGGLFDVDRDSLLPTGDPEAAWWVEILSQVQGARLDAYHLILIRRDGEEIDVGDVRGPAGPTGATGATGPTGYTGDLAAVLTASPFSGNFPMVALGAATPQHLNVTLNGNAVFEFAGFVPGLLSYAISLFITQDAATPTRTVSWTGVKWPQGFPPALGLTTGSTMLVTVVWTGTQWLGLVGGLNFA